MVVTMCGGGGVRAWPGTVGIPVRPGPGTGSTCRAPRCTVWLVDPSAPNFPERVACRARRSGHSPDHLGGVDDACLHEVLKAVRGGVVTVVLHALMRVKLIERFGVADGMAYAPSHWLIAAATGRAGQSDRRAKLVTRMPAVVPLTSEAVGKECLPPRMHGRQWPLATTWLINPCFSNGCGLQFPMQPSTPSFQPGSKLTGLSRFFITSFITTLPLTPAFCAMSLMG